MAYKYLKLANPNALDKKQKAEECPLELLPIVQEALEIEYEPAVRLCYLAAHGHYLGRWPVEFDKAYNLAITREERADIAFWRIQHFIATEGAE